MFSPQANLIHNWFCERQNSILHFLLFIFENYVSQKVFDTNNAHTLFILYGFYMTHNHKNSIIAVLERPGGAKAKREKQGGE